MPKVDEREWEVVVPLCPVQKVSETGCCRHKRSSPVSKVDEREWGVELSSPCAPCKR